MLLHSCFCGEIFFCLRIAVECLAPDLPVSYRQYHCYLSGYLPNKDFLFLFLGFFLGGRLYSGQL